MMKIFQVIMLALAASPVALAGANPPLPAAAEEPDPFEVVTEEPESIDIFPEEPLRLDTETAPRPQVRDGKGKGGSKSGKGRAIPKAKAGLARMAAMTAVKEKVVPKERVEVKEVREAARAVVGARDRRVAMIIC